MASLRWYPSKKDTWLMVILVVAPLLPVAVAGIGWASGQAGAALALVGTAFMLLLYGALVFPMRYGIDDAELVIRFGLARRRIALAEIRAVRPTRNPLSSPALSLDRLLIDIGKGLLGGVMISPLDREAFLADLAARAGLERDGEGLIRRGPVT